MVLPKQIPPGLAHEDVAVQSYEQSGCAVFISFMLTINLLSIISFHIIDCPILIRTDCPQLHGTKRPP